MARPWSPHAAGRRLKPSGVADQRHLDAELGAIGVGATGPAVEPTLRRLRRQTLRRRVAIEEALDVARLNDLPTPELDLIEQACEHAVLIARIAGRNQPGRARRRVDQAPEDEVGLGVHPDDMGAAFDRLERDMGGVDDGRARLDQHVHGVRFKQCEGVRAPLGGRPGRGRAPCPIRHQVGGPAQSHPRGSPHRGSDAEAHGPGADNGDPYRAAFPLKPSQLLDHRGESA